MNQSVSRNTPNTPLPTRTPRYAVIQAGWHAEIVGQAREGFLDELARHGYAADLVDIYTVPGAFEIPLHAQRLARSGRYDGIVATAFVVDGGIYRHDFVASAVIDGLMRVQLDHDVPVFSVVLTPHHFHEHDQHQDYFFRHFSQKGAEAARAALETVASLEQLPTAASELAAA
ncbi:6,7-dimethyl-8-ribityllumazine synthase [Bordetella sp. J329]|jgi:6,7-dimethyl-8-ribityllumazine synthase|uniref:6,7-dimethyl-8-ribityllumazine synthase n=1 Tax=Kerstersia gyiorum TaxID=206506 RepID=UPI000FDB0C24|nr:6,7-dimethyl-8-ribityllumazine synthase [Kerstersia gyiorum]AZV94098.1 6,7-dimethyl-8-ribityllumazine synthase [Bordetella sp. J329]MCH4271482.1 6,7-dimethyl-8-ribityllumazine synthase [Kerstersia gyiorum]MCI1229673.1 6,7-dimethyl-8-ribityllumazine synthase [Kerstersia gyiorum]